MQCIFPEHCTGKRGVPVVLYERHFVKVKIYAYDDKSNRKPIFTYEFTASQNKLFKDVPAYREKKASMPLFKEHTDSLKSPKNPLGNILDNLPNIPAAEAETPPESPLKKLQTPEKKKPRGKSKKMKERQT